MNAKSKINPIHIQMTSLVKKHTILFILFTCIDVDPDYQGMDHPCLIEDPYLPKAKGIIFIWPDHTCLSQLMGILLLSISI